MTAPSKTDSAPRDEAHRVHVEEVAPQPILSRYDVQTAEEKEAFGRLADLAAHLLDAPAATLELFEDDRQHLLASTGLADTFQIDEGTPRLLRPFHRRALQSNGPTVLEDVRDEEPFQNHALVSGEANPPSAATLRFYAGVPVTTTDGAPIGILSVLGTERQRPSTGAVEQVEGLAAMAAEALERHRRSVDKPKLTQAVVEGLSGFFYVLGPDGRLKNWNAQFEEATTFSADELRDREAYAFFEGKDQWRVARAVMKAFARGSMVVEADLVTEGGRRPALFSAVRAKIGDQPHLVGIGVDVTNRKEAETALREERDRLETLFNSLPTPVVHGVVRDDRLDILAVNSAFETVFGYEAASVRGENLHALIVPEEEREQAVRYDQQALDDDAPIREEVRRITAEGPRDFQLQEAGRVREEGPPEAYAIYTDITERKQIEATLREREALLRSITDHISEGIYRSEPAEGIFYASQAFVEMFGYDSLEEVKEIDSADLYARPDERERLLRIDEEEGRIDQVEVEFERKDGSTFVGLLSSRAIRDESGAVRYHDGVITDITERKEYEEQLAYRYELERKVVDISTRFINTPVDDIDTTIEEALGKIGRFVQADRSYVFLVDPDDRTTSNTHEWCAEGVASHRSQLQGLSYDAMPWFMDRMHHRKPLVSAVDDLPDEAAGLRGILEGGDIESLLVLPMMQDNTLVGFVGFDAVKTEQAWSEDTVILLRVLSDALANALQRKEMEEEMIAARREAEKANRLKSAFLANMSHEIRTPLTSIIGFAEALGEEADAQEGPTGRFAELIERSGQRLLETLDAVLNLSKLEAGEMELGLQAMDLAAEAREVTELQSNQAEAAGLDLQFESEAPSVGAWADEGGLRIVLRNLVSNAIKYTDEGGTVWVRVRQGDEAAVLEVEDTGIGMEPDEVPQIFKAFTQTADGVKRSSSGIGLGLAVTKRLVDKMDGTIEVETEKGEGTCFTVRLPQADVPA